MQPSFPAGTSSLPTSRRANANDAPAPLPAPSHIPALRNPFYIHVCHITTSSNVIHYYFQNYIFEKFTDAALVFSDHPIFFALMWHGTNKWNGSNAVNSRLSYREQDYL
jgi:hypothetical protein